MRDTSRSVLRVLVAFAFGLVCTLSIGRASAQSISVVNEASLPRLAKDGTFVQKRPQTLTPEAVNNQDCSDNQLIRFTLQLAGFEAQASVQAWGSNSGADCTQDTARNIVKQCWPLLDSGIPLQSTIDVDIPVRRIMAGAPPFTAATPDATENACGKVDLSTITVHFLYFAPGNQATAATEHTVAVTVDTVGPKPPSGLQALPGNTRIQVTWVNISGGSGDASATGGLTELTGIKVYCDPATSSAATTTTTPNAPVCRDAAVDAGATDSGDAAADAGTGQSCEDGGVTTTTVPGNDCTSPNFVRSDGVKILPTEEFNKKYECGSITGNTGTTVVATEVAGAPLVNGTRYAVAVAATDKYGNVGELSDVVCEMPEVTTDFWQDYRKDGGHAGGCTATGSGLPVGSLGVLGVILAATGSSLRRRWRRDR